MTGWDVLDRVINSFSPIATTILLVATAVICVVGFSKYGLNFFKYGFTQKEVDDLSKKMDSLAGEMNKKMDSLKGEMNKKIDCLAEDIRNIRAEFRGELETIKVNHFGHLKNFLGELTSILLDKNIINNTDKTRLDNQLRDM